MDVQPTTGTYSPGAASSSTVPASTGGHKLSLGAAAGIGVGGALLVVALLGLIFFFVRRARKRKQMLNQTHPPSFTGSHHHSSLYPNSPPPQFSSPYEQPQEVKSGQSEPPPMALIPNFGPQRIPSHELDSAAVRGSPQISAYHSQSSGGTPKRIPSPPSTGLIAPQPRSPPPALTSSGFRYHEQSRGQISPPIGGQRTPGSNHESGSYGFPSHEASPNPDGEGFQFQTPRQQGTGSPESQQHIFPRRVVGSPNLRSSQ